MITFPKLLSPSPHTSQMASLSSSSSSFTRSGRFTISYSFSSFTSRSLSAASCCVASLSASPATIAASSPHRLRSFCIVASNSAFWLASSSRSSSLLSITPPPLCDTYAE